MANGKNGNGRKGGNGRGNGRAQEWTDIAIDVALTGAKFVGIGAAMGFGGYLADRLFPNPKSWIIFPTFPGIKFPA